MVESCSECKHFRVPDDGQEWGLSGVCDHPLLENALIYDVLNAGLAEGLWSLPCGAPVVKQYYCCQFFENAQNNMDDCWGFDR